MRNREFVFKQWFYYLLWWQKLYATGPKKRFSAFLVIWNFSILDVLFTSKLKRNKQPSDWEGAREIRLDVANENNYTCAQHEKPILTFSDVFTCKIEGGALLIFKYLETKAISFLWKLSVIKIGIKCLMIVLLNKESGYRLKSLMIWADKSYKRHTKPRF